MMNKYVKVKNIVIVALCATVILMAAGFVVLSVKLDNVKNELNSFNVEITKVKKVSSLKGGSREPLGDVRISKSKTAVDMEYVLYNPHDEVTYEITVTNKGTITAEINDVIISPDFTDIKLANEYEPLSLSITSVAGKILAPGEEASMKVSVFYQPTKDTKLLGKHSITGKIGIMSKSTESK